MEECQANEWLKDERATDAFIKESSLTSGGCDDCSYAVCVRRCFVGMWLVELKDQMQFSFRQRLDREARRSGQKGLKRVKHE